MLKSDPETKHWVIRVKENIFLDGIGIISLTRHHNNIDTEISYQLLPEWWNKGYGTEVVKAIVNYALTVCGLPRVIAETQIDNTASCRLLKSIGMGLERTVERFGAQQSIFST
jgi:[ribosomal protein S5]-alanine N-acetyltransferase